MKYRFITLVVFLSAVFFLQNAHSLQVADIMNNSKEGWLLHGAIAASPETSTSLITDSKDKNYVENTLNEKVFDSVDTNILPNETHDEEITDKNDSVIQVLKSLDEDIFIAYGTVKAKAFTGIADALFYDDIQFRQASNLTRLIEGASPGLQVSGGTGQPGSGLDIRIRGLNSFNASNEPLYVLDGAPFYGDLNSINPDDIESITILRDASATAIYGIRSANGVIVITTKSGAERNLKINFTAKAGISNRAMPEYPRLSTNEWMVAQFESLRNQRYFQQGQSIDEANLLTNTHLLNYLGGYNAYNMSFDQLFVIDSSNPWLAEINPEAKLLYSEDFQDELFSTAMHNEYMFNLSGGTELGQYYFSIGYLNENGVSTGSGFERLSGRFNGKIKPVDWFETGINLNISAVDYDFLLDEGTYTSNPFFTSRMMGPIYPVYLKDEQGNNILDSDGNKILDLGIGEGPQGVRPVFPGSNIAGVLKLDERFYKQQNFGTRIFGRVHILEGLSFATTYNLDYHDTDNTIFQNPEIGDAAAINGRRIEHSYDKRIVTFNQMFNYNRLFNFHNFDFLVGHESHQMDLEYSSISKTGFSNIGIDPIEESSTSYSKEYRLESYFARLNYDYKNKYFVSTSFRRDGSSRFHKNARWGNFWAIGLSWQITQENFMQEISWLDNINLKASHGKQGNDMFETYYLWQGYYNDGWDNYNMPGAIVSLQENRNLIWDSKTSTNFGFNFGLFNRLRGELSYFLDQASNLVLYTPIPPSTGTDAIYKNIGAMQNEGVEFRSIVDIIRTNLLWNIDFNITHFKNKITDMPELIDGLIVGTKKWKTGRSIYDYYLRKVSHIDPATGSTMFYYNILNDDGEIIDIGATSDVSLADRYYTGDQSIHDFFGTFTNNFSYGSFYLSVMFAYGVGGKMYDNVYSWLMHEGRSGYHMHADIANRWRSPEDVSTIPKVELGNGFLYPTNSDQYLVDMTFLSLKNITLSYKILQNLSKQSKLDGLILFVTGENLATWNNHKGMSPQQSSNGHIYHSYIPVRSITFGVNIQI